MPKDRNAENNYFKTKKLECDILYLNTCKEYSIVPRFIHFKVHNPGFCFSKLYRSWSFRLLDLEIKTQNKKLKRCLSVYENSLHGLKSVVSFFDYSCLLSLISSSADRKISKVKAIHQRKLKNLGIDLSKKVDTDKVIFNLSSKNLSHEEKEVLSLGLDFALKPKRVSYFNYYLSFEKICGILKNCDKYGNEDWNAVFNKISYIANSTFKKLVRFCYSDTVNDERIKVLKILKEDPNIIVTKPDKGRGVVIMDRLDYENKIANILSDVSRFKLLKVDVSSHILKLEDKLNRLLRSIKDTIGDNIYNELHASGSRPGFLYGLPKIHKPGNPIRPIISTIGTFTYNLAKFLVPLIDPLTKNEYTIDNSTNFVNELKNLRIPPSAVMASFDIESLFTNVPLDETTSIIVNKLVEGDYNIMGLDKRRLTKLLDISTSESVFIFNNKLYSQIDGVSMGSCLGPSYANAFLCYYENIWLSECPLAFKPLYYRRYVDDTFVIFKEQSHVTQFLDYLNTRHRNINFTYEIEEENKIAFLDTLIVKENGTLSSAVYRKPTFTGLGLNYLSFIPNIFKINSITTLLNRAFNLSSSYETFHSEISKLRKYFVSNSYPTFLFDKVLKRFLNSKFLPAVTVNTVRKDVRYIKIPFLGPLSFSIRKQLLVTLKRNFPQIDFKIVFSNNFTIASLLKKQREKPFDLTSNVVYLFSCPCCTARYIGSSTQWLSHRICGHIGISTRTALPLSNPPFSAIRNHLEETDHPFTHRNFEILTSNPHRSDLLTLEALYINKMKPSLNSQIPVKLFTQ